MIEIQWLVKGFPVLGIGCWLLLAAVNNLVDGGTNIALLTRMMSMKDLRDDKILGQGLLTRAITDPVQAPLMLKGIAVAQIIIASALIFSSLMLVLMAFNIQIFQPSQILLMTSSAVLLFMCFWFFFLIGGLWFGYWIKMGNVQAVHFMMLVFSMLLQVILYLPIGHVV